MSKCEKSGKGYGIAGIFIPLALIVFVLFFVMIMATGCLRTASNETYPNYTPPPVPPPGAIKPITPTHAVTPKIIPKPTLMNPMFCNETIKCRFSNQTCIGNLCRLVNRT